jgi:hypothetical protein
MSTCIYCPAEAKSREHWIQRALGTFRGYTPLLDRLCTACNRFLGRELDEELMRTGLIGYQRALSGVEGRDGAPSVNPFLFRAMKAQQPTELLMPVPHASHRVLGEAYKESDGTKCAKPLRQIIVRQADGRTVPLPLPRAWTAEQLRTAAIARQVAGDEVIEVYFDDDDSHADMVRTRALLEEVFGVPRVRNAIVFGGSSGERQVKGTELTAGMTRRYIRGVAKTAFHYFLWTTLGGMRGDEPFFADVRAFIRDDVGDWRQFVELDAPHFVPLFQGRDRYVPRQTSHFFHAALTSTEAFAHVQFFVGPGQLPPPSKVRLAQNPLRIDARLFSCHQAQYFETGRSKDGHQGEIIEIPCWERRVVLT